MKHGITVIHKLDGDMVDYPTAQEAAKATHQTAKTVQDIAAGRKRPLHDYDFRFTQGISGAGILLAVSTHLRKD